MTHPHDSWGHKVFGGVAKRGAIFAMGVVCDASWDSVVPFSRSLSRRGRPEKCDSSEHFLFRPSVPHARPTSQEAITCWRAAQLGWVQVGCVVASRGQRARTAVSSVLSPNATPLRSHEVSRTLTSFAGKKRGGRGGGWCSLPKHSKPKTFKTAVASTCFEVGPARHSPGLLPLLHRRGEARSACGRSSSSTRTTNILGE